MDFFKSAFDGKISSIYEYFLVGSVLDPAKDGLLEILRGLCDNSESKPIEFAENESIYTYTMNGNPLISLRARCSRNQPNSFWHLKYVGQTDTKEDKMRGSMVRSYIDCITSANLPEYLQALGFNLEAEYYITGHIFHKGRIKVLVSKIFIVTNNEIKPVNGSHLVEVTCIVEAKAGAERDKEVKAFADLLRPYVKMDKLHVIAEEAPLPIH